MAKRTKKILLLGSTGKMGSALRGVFESDHPVICKNSSNFDALDLSRVRSVIEEEEPDIVINAIACLGIDPCEEEPEKALQLNALFPKLLAELSNEKGFLLVHFSTDAVFNDEKKDFYTESDSPKPLNVYGSTKYEGDLFIQSIAEKYYIVRISLLFGQTGKKTQFVEKMFLKVKEGAKTLRISDDLILSPTYNEDVAGEIKKMLDDSVPYGLYHIVNEGKVSLYEFMKEIVDNLNLDVRLEKASHKDFPGLGVKNTCTPLKSEKLSALRPWKKAVKAYCEKLMIENSYVR